LNLREAQGKETINLKQSNYSRKDIKQDTFEEIKSEKYQ
jgi:hypothetical protein